MSVPQFIISPFNSNDGMASLIATSADNRFPSSILWQYSINTLIQMSPLAGIISIIFYYIYIQRQMAQESFQT